jgi:mannose-6-phosphate isomerase-like protein (cupin superfamily)
MSTPPDTPADADADAGAAHQGDTGTRVPPRYPGPMLLASALTNFTRGDSTFRRDGPRADVEYRDFGWAGASSGVIGAKHIRAIRPFDAETGWHWHDMTGHFIYVLRGWLRFRYAGIDDAVTVHAGQSLSQPAGVAHNVVGRSDDMEVIEINLPAAYGTWEVAPARGADGIPA